MFDGAESFNDWYHDSSRSERVELALVMEEGENGAYVFDNAAFFPLDGLGYKDRDENGHNYLFTTEVHLEFVYYGGEEFTFRGDDDLWIFVDGKIALDLGGMHWPFQGTIVFDELGLTQNQSYHMDIFHAERHTSASNFRIETNIECFTSFIPEVE
ncbi:MAG: fibro-slime domain-containing protein [Deltaproteobacteria bacterium]|nr:fibro-slime domain-containing protein [Deltaproteobacteria bacterium]